MDGGQGLSPVTLLDTNVNVSLSLGTGSIVVTSIGKGVCARKVAEGRKCVRESFRGVSTHDKEQEKREKDDRRE